MSPAQDKKERVEEGVTKNALRQMLRGRHAYARWDGEVHKVPESRIPRRAGHRALKVAPPRVHPIEECRVLELPDRDVEAHGGEAGLDHLLERRLAAPHGEGVERDAPGAQPPARRGGVEGERGPREGPRDARGRRGAG